MKAWLSKFFLILFILLYGVSGSTHATVIADLASDYSDGNTVGDIFDTNSWSFRQGDTDLVWDGEYYSVSDGNYWHPAVGSNIQNWTGVAIHSTDANSTYDTEANIVWESTIAGTINIDSKFSHIRFDDRSTYWNVLINDVSLGSGLVSSNQKEESFIYQLTNVAIGDEIKFAFSKGPGNYGDFTGVDIKITDYQPSSVPEPASALLFGFGLLGITATARRTRNQDS